LPSLFHIVVPTGSLRAAREAGGLAHQKRRTRPSPHSNSSSPRTRGPSWLRLYVGSRVGAARRLRLRGKRSCPQDDDRGEVSGLCSPCAPRAGKVCPCALGPQSPGNPRFPGAQTGAQGVPYVPFIVTMAFSFAAPNLSAVPLPDRIFRPGIGPATLVATSALPLSHLHRPNRDAAASAAG
jgi:hypothetical protein